MESQLACSGEAHRASADGGVGGLGEVQGRPTTVKLLAPAAAHNTGECGCAISGARDPESGRSRREAERSNGHDRKAVKGTQ